MGFRERLSARRSPIAADSGAGERDSFGPFLLLQKCVRCDFFDRVENPSTRPTSRSLSSGVRVVRPLLRAVRQTTLDNAQTTAGRASAARPAVVGRFDVYMLMVDCGPA
jgi:hypothetical protein